LVEIRNLVVTLVRAKVGAAVVREAAYVCFRERGERLEFLLGSSLGYEFHDSGQHPVVHGRALVGYFVTLPLSAGVIAARK
jgi:hypothetical protein